jgi:hypothetical protein
MLSDYQWEANPHAFILVGDLPIPGRRFQAAQHWRNDARTNHEYRLPETPRPGRPVQIAPAIH